MPQLTPSQTIGPFFAVMMPLGSNYLVAPDTPGAITIEGRVFDGAGDPVGDALLEIWQADPAGRYLERAPNEGEFTGFGRCATDSGGKFSFVTLKPGRVPAPDEGEQAPHILVSVFARGLLRRLVTRLYFPGEERANAVDPVLRSIGDPAIRSTLIADQTGETAYRFDIHLRGEKETAFFAL